MTDIHDGEEIEVLVWTADMVDDDEGYERVAVFADVADPDIPDRVIHRDGIFLRVDAYDGCHECLLELPEVVDLIERVESMAQVKYVVRHSPDDDGVEYDS